MPLFGRRRPYVDPVISGTPMGGMPPPGPQGAAQLAFPNPLASQQQFNTPGRDERMAALTADLPAGRPAGKGGFFKKGGMGRNMLFGALGSIGDALTGNDAFAQGQLQKQKLLWEETADRTKRQRDYEDAIRLYTYKQENPETPDVAQEAEYWRRQGRDDIADDLIAKSRLVPIQRADEESGEIRTEYVRPSSLFGGEGGGGSGVRITSKEQYDALPPGTPYIAPDGSHRVKGGQ